MKPFALSALLLAAPLVAQDRPNIVLILVDDMGFSDLGCYGGEIPTPNLDALAAGGLRYTRFYNTGRCCPTRTSLLTGLYSHQAGVGHMTADLGVPGYRGALNDRCVTLGDVLGAAGYHTAISGKWHVGHRTRDMWPRARGFDRFYGVPEGGGFYFAVKKGRSLVLDDEVVADVDRPVPEGWYTTDAWTEYGLKFIDDAIAREKPFFLYLAHNAPHFPLQATEADIVRFRGKFMDGWDRLSDRRVARQNEMGLFAREVRRAPRPKGVSAWDSLSDEERERFDHLMAAYAATMWRMDLAVGELVDGLRKRGVLDDTLILFLSDNGGSAEGGVKGKTVGDPTKAKSNWYCGKSWAWLSDTPFRKFKHFSHEGGTATPLIAHWPNGIAARGEVRRQVGHVIDLMPTLADVAGAEYPAEHEGHAVLAMEGESLVASFRDAKPDRGPLFWEHEGNAAIRRGYWKLVRQGARGEWELYDLEADRTELADRIGDEPVLAADLEAEWLRWAERCGVNPGGLPKQRKNE